MLALRVTINKKIIIAGTDDLCVLSAIVSMTGKLGTKTLAPGRGKPDMFLHVGGLTSRGKGKTDEHLRWTPHVKLKLGDRVVIEPLESVKADKTLERSAAERRDERGYYLQLKKQYLALKKKYEPES